MNASRQPALSRDEVLLRVRQIASEVAGPQAEAVDREARWPAEALGQLQAQGLGGLVVPVSAGGLGHGLLALVEVCEALGRCCPSTAICFGMHCVGAAVIAAKATPEQHERYLVPIAAGEHLTTLAVSEPGTGVHFYLPQTALRESDDGYVVSGTKSFVTNGGMADSYVVSTVAAEAEAPPGQFSCVLIRDGLPGVEWQEPWNGLGMRGNSARSVGLGDVRIAPYDLLGDRGDQIWYVFQVIAPYFLMAMAGTYLGVATAALDEAVAHLRHRSYGHGGTDPGDHPIVQRDLGALWRRVERTRRLIYFAAAEGDAGGPDALPALCSAKAEVAECAVDAVNSALTLTGGIGYREHSKLGRLLRDARAAHVMSPSTSLLETWIGRHLLGQPLLAD
ncbi:MAG TPA: acyl-CoA dehydrogenase family protein [Thermoanaerobaculia bacterium]|nr:acyl-CoA dehydrogenase family protein [Thermoanaerobaculia bacterium]